MSEVRWSRIGVGSDTSGAEKAMLQEAPYETDRAARHKTDWRREGIGRAVEEAALPVGV